MGVIRVNDYNEENQRRQKPVVLILDVSGSMHGDRIDQLNRGVRGMLADFATLRETSVEFFVSIVIFGGDKATLYIDYTSIKDIKWKDLEANGRTPLGSALHLAKSIVDDNTKLSKNAYRPTVILMSDGAPTDSEYLEELSRFTGEGRTARCDRFVAAVKGASQEVLEKFIVNDNCPPDVREAMLKSHYFNAEESGNICEFMKFMSASICKSSQSANPNVMPVTEIQLEVEQTAADLLDDSWGDDDPNALFDQIAYDDLI